MTKIVFADEKVKKAFDKLRDTPAEKRLYDTLMRAFKDIEESPTAFIHIGQKLIPKEYVSKYKSLCCVARLSAGHRSPMRLVRSL